MDFRSLETPCYVVDAARIRRNAEIMRDVQRRSGCRILLALKGFAMFRTFPLIRDCLAGVTASSVSEAFLGKNEFGGELHAYAPAYSDRDIADLAPIVDHLVFNSLSQLDRHRKAAAAVRERGGFGLRVNPEHSEVKTAIYDPCRARSRLGVTAARLEGADLEEIAGFHFHTLCGHNSDALERTFEVVERKFGPWLKRLSWINFGGGHHISRDDYDLDGLCRLVERARSRHGVEVYLEPGEAVALNAGVLVASVLDVVENDGRIAILDVSGTAHMPDVLEMPYRPDIRGAAEPGAKAHTYHLGGLTCLAGDEIGAYSFDRPLAVGDRLVFEDMAHYTMVKNTTFNGVRLPSIAMTPLDGGAPEVVRSFGYEDYRNRLS